MEAIAKAPASLSNLGPGFDSLGLAISGFFDTVVARRRKARGVEIVSISKCKEELSRVPNENCASASVLALLDQTQADFGVELEIIKGIPLGSGIGGSASSAAAATIACNALLDIPLAKENLVEAVLAGEFVASKARHGDNALPALMGGIIVVSAHQAESFVKIEAKDFPVVVLLLPDLLIKTSEARKILPEQVPFRDAINNASDLARLISGLVSSDWNLVGQMIMSDRFVEPRRTKLIPGFKDIREGALQAGAFGCALSGSGPAIFSLAKNLDHAEEISAAMQSAAESNGMTSQIMMSSLDTRGAELCT